MAKEEEVEERRKIGDKMESNSTGPGEKSGVEDIEEFNSTEERGHGSTQLSMLQRQLPHQPHMPRYRSLLHLLDGPLVILLSTVATFLVF